MQFQNPFKKNGRDFNFDRSRTDKLLNKGIVVVIGGHRADGKGKEPRELEIREPASETFDKHIEILLDGLGEFSKMNIDRIRNLKENPTGSIMIEDLLKIKDLKSTINKLVAEIVGESEEFVRKEMSGSQITKVLSAYGKVCQLETFKNLFLSALRGLGIWNPDESPREISREPSSESPPRWDGASIISNLESGSGNSG